MAVTGLLALDQLQTHIMAAAILAIILTLAVAIWLEFTIRIRRGVTTRRQVDLKDTESVRDVVRTTNQYLAYGNWIPIYRISACVILVGSLLAIVLTLLF